MQKSDLQLVVDSCIGMCMAIDILNVYVRRFVDVNDVKLLGSIGSGAYGTVYKAVWRGSIVAAKLMDTRGNENVFKNELNIYKYAGYINLH